MNIRFLHQVKHLNQASARIRIITPSEGMKKLGFDGAYNKKVDKKSIGIIHKCNTDSLKYKSICKKIIWDVCDNYFYQKQNTDKALFILKNCDAVTTTTEKLKEIILDHCKNIGVDKKVYLVDDPVYYDFKTPTFNPNENLNIVWYGNDGNLQYFNWKKHFFDPLMKSNLPKINLTFINNRGTIPKGTKEILTKHNVTTMKWSIKDQMKQTSKADFVILPIDHNHPFTAGKSHNKLVYALACGTMPIVSPQSSYLKFSDYAYVGNNFIESIFTCINNTKQTLNRIEQGQKYITENLSDVNIANRWIEIAEELYNE